MTNPTYETSVERMTEEELVSKYGDDTQTAKTAELFCLARFWEHCIFSGSYSAAKELTDQITFRDAGMKLIKECCDTEGVLENDAKLALFGKFFWHEVLVDVDRTDIEALRRALSTDLFNDKVRLPYSWGRLLHDRFNDDGEYCGLDRIPHSKGWQLLNGTPIGVFQHGHYVTGPLGVIKTDNHRWIPVFPVVSRHTIDGTQKVQRGIPFGTATIGVVKAYVWMLHRLERTYGPPSDWDDLLRWHGSSHRSAKRVDYNDITLVIADCVLGQDLTDLVLAVLKSPSNPALRKGLKGTPKSGLANLSPNELALSLTGVEQLQLLHCVSDSTLVSQIEALVLSQKIQIPSSEVRYSHRKPPSKATSFASEVSSLGIRPAHPKPFAALWSAILQAYLATDSTELQWRLGSDASRGLQVTLTEYVRKSGPQQSVRELILTSQPVTEKICQTLCIPITEIGLRDEATISRILWKFGFEIPRHDDLLDRFKKRLASFESLLLDVDWARGEVTRERIRSEGVNLFVSVEEFLDRLVSYNVWLLASDHWETTRFNYRLSAARSKVAEVLGATVESSEGKVSWKVNGENPLGTQLIYLSQLERWLECLGERDVHLIRDAENKLRDDFGRPFPFRHSVLWADSDAAELERYREYLRRVTKAIFSGDIAGVRNGLDHQRDPSRFPTEDQLEICTNKLKQSVSLAEQGRLYPITFWFEEEKEKVFGSSEFVFKAGNGTLFSLYRPSMVSSLPNVTRIRPIIIAPFNFLGVADGILHFNQMGESNYSEYWAGYPRIAKSKEASVQSPCGYEETVRDIATINSEALQPDPVEEMHAERSPVPEESTN